MDRLLGMSLAVQLTHVDRENLQIHDRELLNGVTIVVVNHFAIGILLFLKKKSNQQSNIPKILFAISQILSTHSAVVVARACSKQTFTCPFSYLYLSMALLVLSFNFEIKNKQTNKKNLRNFDGLDLVGNRPFSNK